MRVDRNSWCTPREVWHLALRCAGRDLFDLDPCSNEHSTVPAKQSVCLPDNGLSFSAYTGEVVWMNPPYGRGHPQRWFAWARQQRGRGAHVYGVLRFDTSTEAWRKHGPDVVWSPPKRWQFIPPPWLTDSSGANFVSVLALWSADQDMRAMMSRELEGLGGYLMGRRECG